ncbi:MAG: efflux RND transporter permease subunit [Spirochaetes bacterium]|nr:efflux RND transporter permease subunit [Spirochaetota bacterium]
MKKIINFLTEQKLFVNLLVFLTLVLGISIIMNMNREVTPQVNFDMVTIKTIYPGASPDEVEKLVTIPIEKKIREIDWLDKVRSYNIENASVIVVYIDMSNPDIARTVQDIKDAVELVSGLPESAEKPVVEELKLDKTPVINIAVYGKNDNVKYRDLYDTAERLEDYLYEIDGVAEVEDYGLLDREYLVEVDAQKLISSRIGLNYVIYRLQQRNVDLPGGELRIGNQEYLLKTKDQYRNVEDIENTVIWSNDLGYVTRIKDVTADGKVKDTFKEPSTYERVNSNNAIVYTVNKKRSADEIKTADRIYDRLKEFPHDENIEIYKFEDVSEITREQIESVLVNAATGFLLLAAILYVLLGQRMASVVMIGFPIAFMIGFIGLDIAGLTINVISLFGMIMVLGMIVDFGIVVTENTHRYLELGHNRKEAIQLGTSEVTVPLLVTFLCLISAFMPLAMLTGIFGKFTKAIPIVVLVCLGASLVTALFIMPTHLNMIAKEPKKKKTKKELKEIEEGYESGLFGRFQHKYRSLLELSIKHRYITIVILLVLLFGCLALVGSGKVGFKFMMSGGESGVTIKTYMPQGTNLNANLAEMKKLEKIVYDAVREDEFSALRIRVGTEDFGILDPQPGEGSHKSTVLLSLTTEKKRKRTASEIVDDIRNRIEEAREKCILNKEMTIRTEVEEEGPPVGKPVNVEIRGDDFAVLQKIAREYETYLKTIKGVYDIKIDTEPGKLEYRYSIDEVMAARTGVSSRDAAVILNASYKGAVATRVHKGKDEIGIRVRFPEKARSTESSLKKVMIANQNGGLIPLDKITSMNKEYGTAFINRLNFKRLVQVQGEVDSTIITSIEVNKDLFEKFRDIEARYPGYSISYGGEQEDTDKSMADLGNLFLIALLIIYIILAVYFESLMLPFVVMIAIPFSLIGVILAVFIHGDHLSFMSMLGIFSLAGVIVSNTLVLVRFINNLRDKGLPLKEALIEGGVIRLRPVLLTAGTTVLGLFPTIYGLGGMNYFVAPLALSFGYGLIFATIITLVLVPSFYHISEDIKSASFSLMGSIDSMLGRFIEKIKSFRMKKK